MWHLAFRAKRARAVRRAASVTGRETVLVPPRARPSVNVIAFGRANVSDGWVVGFPSVIAEGPS